ncbi:SMC family ATPase [Streptomyces sp. ActVer]|uniref:AAA family ATPase n=1 Tax=Streptomyces sp. ActVer TaxID=3014558 RepID=UPI0022B2DEE2|nr:SMC family ATPase [Streptomyces sp. ActVer]MCZ4508155.1 SMC family ATPase [Streptomyces sp. ActVer]
MLSLTGFRSYPTPVTVEFTGRSLVAALGDTGAGKSSLLDAIVFALFRKSSWDAKEPRQLIADGAQAMSVELTFLHDGQRWHVHRTMHATNANAGRHHLKNLDTGEEIDNASAVDARIRAVLQMSYDTFLRVGLLPQGKFDQLLTAVPRERSERLRELFGAESLESVQQMAGRHCLTLKGLLGDARVKRAVMPEDPEQAAAEAGKAADAAAARAERLNTAIDRITALQEETTAARAIAEAAATAARTLSARTVTDANTVLDELEPVAAAIASRRDALDRRAAQAATREGELTAAITAADTGGEGRDALGKAAVVLETLTERAEEHRGERDRLAALTEQLDSESAAIVATEAELTKRAEHAKPLAEAARAAAEASQEIRTCATTVRTLITAAISAVRRVADTASDQAAAVAKHDVVHEDVGPLGAESATAEKDVTNAETHLETLQLRDKAAAIAAELHPGGDCLVCRRKLPADFEPASETGTAELAAAREQLRETKASRDKAAGRLAEARAAVTAAEEAVCERGREHQSAQHKAQEATANAVRAFADLAALAAATEADFDAESASATLTAAAAALAEPAADAALEQSPERYTAPIADAVTACELAAAAHAERLQNEAHGRTAVIEAECKALAGRRSSHQRDLDAVTAASERHTLAVARMAAEVRALPVRIQAMLPGEAIDVSADDVAAAAAAVAARLTEVQVLFDERETQRSQKNAVLDQQRALDQETRTAVERPLNELRGALDVWAQAVTQAITHLGAADPYQVPQAPAEPGITEIRQYTADLSKTASRLGDQLAEVSAAGAARAAAALTGLGEHAAALADVDGFDPAADLTAPQVLHPLVAAAATAAKEVEDQHRKQREAQVLIKPAADLDFAIAAGQARYEALDVLRRELVDAKFLGHLTTLRTRALLGVASDLLGQMTDMRFGFADSFDIVSRSSGVVHQPNRLSGGEKFLASLALALALAEVHARSGPSLGSLFLDEGFAALDTTALDSALEVLRAQAGGDRLVMVISHLHAVAEAFDDVLWVRRNAAGSSARWLTPDQRDELVQADLASGLQKLAQ